jgi:Flp pilus assembly protein TadD
MTRLAAGDPAGAEADLRQVVERSPDRVAALNGLASALLARGALDEAERLSRRVLDLAPADPVAARTLGEIGARRGARGGGQ